MRSQGPTRDRIENFDETNRDILFQTKTACLSNYGHRTHVTDILV